MTSPKKPLLRCVSYCTATGYDLPALNNSFKRKGYISRLSRDVLHISSIDTPVDIFFFSHGSTVFWGLKQQQEKKWLENVRPYEIDPLTTIEVDHFCFCFGETVSMKAHDRFKLDVITLDSDNAQIKLAISHGLAQSIKLESFEDTLQKIIKRNSYLPVEIATKGKISLSRRHILRHMGEIFITRNLINLNSEYLDLPEFFWRNPHLETYYLMAKNFLDIQGRVAALNQKLDVLQDLLHIFNSQVQHRHSSFLEVIVILLIFIEIVISLMTYLVH